MSFRSRPMMPHTEAARSWVSIRPERQLSLRDTHWSPSCFRRKEWDGIGKEDDEETADKGG
jgi:hypothetical protein